MDACRETVLEITDDDVFFGLTSMNCPVLLSRRTYSSPEAPLRDFVTVQFALLVFDLGIALSEATNSAETATGQVIAPFAPSQLRQERPFHPRYMRADALGGGGEGGVGAGDEIPGAFDRQAGQVEPYRR